MHIAMAVGVAFGHGGAAAGVPKSYVRVANYGPDPKIRARAIVRDGHGVLASRVTGPGAHRPRKMGPGAHRPHAGHRRRLITSSRASRCGCALAEVPGCIGERCLLCGHPGRDRARELRLSSGRRLGTCDAHGVPRQLAEAVGQLRERSHTMAACRAHGLAAPFPSPPSRPGRWSRPARQG
jgi:hypothetical protein